MISFVTIYVHIYLIQLYSFFIACFVSLVNVVFVVVLNVRERN